MFLVEGVNCGARYCLRLQGSNQGFLISHPNEPDHTRVGIVFNPYNRTPQLPRSGFSPIFSGCDTE
jgi:hypothetical protein